MLKQEIAYTDFNDEDVVDVLYFNVTKSELMENLHLKDELEELQSLFEGDKREVTPDEIRQMLDLVKTLMRLSYGIRTEDGKRFIKNEDVWTEFTQTPAYDAFLFSLFEDPDRAFQFIVGILPKDLREKAASSMKQGETAELYSPKSDEPYTTASTKESAAPGTPDWVREGRQPTQKELVEMTPEEFDRYKKTQQ